jgi:hypothetical protein
LTKGKLEGPQMDFRGHGTSLALPLLTKSRSISSGLDYSNSLHHRNIIAFLEAIGSQEENVK